MDKQLCIVLRAVNYKDYDKILTLFSRSEGKINAQARGVRKLTSGLSTASQPLCCAEYEFYQKNEKRYITNALVRQEYFQIQNDYPKYISACVMLELTEKILQGTNDYDRLFVLVANALFGMEAGTLDENSALAYFFAHAIDILGVSPAIGFCCVCGKVLQTVAHWSAREGGAVCTGCAGQVATVKANVEIIALFEQLVGVRPQNAEQAQLAEERGVLFVGLANEYILAQTDLKLRTMRYFARKE